MKKITTILSIIFLISYPSVIYSQTSLTKLNTYDIDDNVSEPSGLAFDGEYLYTISDDSPFIYKYNTNGVFLERFNTGLKDLEGIAFFGKNTLLLAVESSNTLVEYNYVENNSIEYPVTYKNSDPSGDSGIEGVAYDSNNNTIYFLNEKDPGALIIAGSNDFQVIEEYKLNFADDYSGAHFVSKTNELWIASDNEGLIYRTTLTGEVIESIDPNIDVDDKLEGIAIDYENKLIFLVTDSGQHLIKYSFSPPTVLSINQNNTLPNNSEISVINKNSTLLSINSAKFNLKNAKLYNIKGHLLVNTKADNSNRIQINTKGLKKGVYILYINNSEAIKITL